jgi:hypothetical protein
MWNFGEYIKIISYEIGPRRISTPKDGLDTGVRKHIRYFCNIIKFTFLTKIPPSQTNKDKLSEHKNDNIWSA